MKALLIEDEASTARAIDLILTTEGFTVNSTDLGEQGLDLGKRYEYDVVLLDLNLPDMLGYEVLKRLRASGVQTPVLIISGISDIDAKVTCFGFGADDYITKPFQRDELLARVRAVLRRSRNRPDTIVCCGNLEVNLDAKTVESGGMAIPLTGKEYAILELLALRKGMTLTKEMFMNHLYAGRDEPEPKIIDVFVSKLRRKLRMACSTADPIETVWGRGYKMRDSDEYALAA